MNRFYPVLLPFSKTLLSPTPRLLTRAHTHFLRGTVHVTSSQSHILRAAYYQSHHSSTSLLTTSRSQFSVQRKHLSSTMASATTFYDFTPKDKKGETFDFSQLKGKVVLIVNTASKCGFTPQFEGLEKLYQKIKSSPQGSSFQILGFPCNQFGNQDPGDNDTIQSFCQVNYGVTFPVLGKTDVNGANAEPLFEWLKAEAPGILGLKRVKWNFEKFLVGTDGKVKGRWASTTKPDALEDSILKELQGVEGTPKV